MEEVMPDQLPDILPQQSGIITLPHESPWSLSWWFTSTATGLNGDVAGYHLAQGWRITDITYDDTTVPPTPYYDMTKESLNNAIVLQNLLNSFTIAQNNALANTELRYNEVLANWMTLLGNTEDYLDTQADGQEGHVKIFFANLDTYMTEVDDLIAENQTQLVQDALVATDALTELNAKLGDLETNATANATTVESLLASQAGYLSTFLTDFAAKLSELDTNYTAHLTLMVDLLADADTSLADFEAAQAPTLLSLEAAYTSLVPELEGLLGDAAADLTTYSKQADGILTAMAEDYTAIDTDVTDILTDVDSTLGTHATDYNAVLALLKTDHEQHVITATAFLDDLGATDLARINEEFAAKLATQLQQLVDRGLYSAVVAVDITERNHRDRDEQIQMLNDRLMREQWENQHKVYGQQVDMRARNLEGKDRIHALRQDVLRYRSAQVVGLYQLLQHTRDRTLASRTTVYQLRDAHSRLNIEVQTRLYEAGQAVRKILLSEMARLHQFQQAVTSWKGDQRDRLLVHLQQVVAQHLTGIDKQHAAQQDVSRVAMSERDVLLAQLQDAVKGFLAGKEAYAQHTMLNASTLADHRHKMIVEKMNAAAQRLAGLQDKHTEDMELMKYMLSERNQLLVGLYGFVERRDDVAPRWESLAQMVVGLADSGGGWTSP
jgi:hypothetical protein